MLRFLLAAAMLSACAPTLRAAGPTRSVGLIAPVVAEAPLDDPAPSLVAVSPAPSARPQPAPTPAQPRVRRSEPGTRIATAAKWFLDHPTDGFRDDCSGFVCAVYDRAGLDIRGSTESLWQAAEADGRVHKRRTPHPGDLAFFDDTFDRNGNGRVDDPLTHVAVVIEVAADGTVLLAHRGSRAGRSTLRMNLRRPHDHTDEDGRVLNDYLRAASRRDRAGTRYLAAELWRGFASPDG